MSYILEALKKAEQQRELGRVPGIASEHDAKSAGTRKYWLWLLVLVLVVNAAALLVLLWPGRSAGPPAEVATQAPARPLVEPLQPPARATIPAPQPSPEITSETPEALRPVPPPPPAVTGEEGFGPDSRDVPATSAAADGGTSPAARVEPAPLPVWPQIPGHVFEQLNSSLRLDVHVYSDQPQGRFVLINLRKYREGDDLQEGPFLEEITPEGVILSFRGQRFRVQRQ